MCRAFAAVQLGENRPETDRVSWIFLPRMFRYLLRLGLWRCLLKRTFGPPGTFSYVVSRSLAIDQVYEAALRGRISQVVILGAGFDTRAFRFEKLLEASVFELDLGNTQQIKQRRLNGFHVPIPENLHFVPIDFQRDSLESRLTESGYDPSAPTLFIMEGLTMYLSPSTVTSTFQFIRERSAPGSEVIFDVMHRDVTEGRANGYGADTMVDLLAKHQSPFQYVDDPASAVQLVEEVGLDVSRTWSGPTLEDVLAKAGRRLRNRVAGYLTLIHAVNPAR